MWENPVTGEWEQQGCMCEMTFKVQIEDVVCWKKKATYGQQSGWPEELNGVK